jgi:hypothetical protein
VIAGRHGGHSGADGLDDAGALVTADHGKLHRRHVARDHVIVRVTQPRGHDLDEYLVGLRLVEVDLGDLPLPRLGEQDGRFGLHWIDLR